MRVLILSDLHDDFWAECKRNPFEGLKGTIAKLDYLLLAGDVSNKPTIRWKYAFERLSKLLPLERVSVFPGNHDFYDFRIDGEGRLKEIASSFGVNYAQKKQIILGDTRILCATLWTDFELGLGSALNAGTITSRMNDYKKIRVAAQGYRKLWPSDLLSRHRDHMRWLEDNLSKSFDGQTFIATHHAPHQCVLPDEMEGLEAAYASDLSGLITTYKPDQWFFGHCHNAQDTKLDKTQLCNVSLGYPDEVNDPSARIASLIHEV
ncbi:metallophosphoesterase [Ruegeria sp. ANG-R]|uniref:metallophosphoesterase n=1 Tax=Ruegeria sp. ANG-R TaxID=1577903 RepID=UPI000691AB85|nr:metallophosphoesterase [Ruegeria sp. ANG-R]